VTAGRICPTPGCPNITTGGRCDTHQRQADQARGTATERGYTSRGHQRFRRTVLRRDPTCVCVDTSHDHPAPCSAQSTVADHYPRSRRELVAAGANPDDPAHGRGICTPCHNRRTAADQPGGWNAR
jgi:5-methylcytosine-specific restriction enzyme A